MTNKKEADFIRPDEIKQYYCVHYHHIGECRWVRNPFCDWEMVEEIIQSLPYQYDPETQYNHPMFEDFTILPEKRLSLLHQKWNNETQEWEDDEFTNREVELDGRYESFAERETGIRSLTRKTNDAPNWISIGEPIETLEEWKQRVKVAKEKQEKEDDDAFELNKRLFKLYRQQNGAPEPFLAGNCTFRQPLEGSEDFKKQLAQSAIKKALPKGFKD